jgi:hypothetical protein
MPALIKQYRLIKMLENANTNNTLFIMFLFRNLVEEKISGKKNNGDFKIKSEIPNA